MAMMRGVMFFFSFLFLYCFPQLYIYHLLSAFSFSLLFVSFFFSPLFSRFVGFSLGLVSSYMHSTRKGSTGAVGMQVR